MHAPLPNIVHATDRYYDPDAYSVYSVIVPSFSHDELGVWLILGATVPFRGTVLFPSSQGNDSQPSAAMKNNVELN